MPDPASRRAAHEAGMRAEQAVARFLRDRGWEILASRWLGGGGEIDLIARRDGRLRFVEVKLRQPDDPVGVECVDARKLERIRLAAEVFLQDYNEPVEEACLLLALAEPGDGQLTLHLLDDPA